MTQVDEFSLVTLTTNSMQEASNVIYSLSTFEYSCSYPLERQKAPNFLSFYVYISSKYYSLYFLRMTMTRIVTSPRNPPNATTRAVQQRFVVKYFTGSSTANIHTPLHSSSQLGKLPLHIYTTNGGHHINTNKNILHLPFLLVLVEINQSIYIYIYVYIYTGIQIDI